MTAASSMSGKIAVLNVGNELTSGQTANTGLAAIAELCERLGFEVACQVTVPDEMERIAKALRFALKGNRFVFVTGGLGPTKDDLTREAVAAALGRRTVFSPSLYSGIEARFAERGRAVPESSRKLARLIQGARPLANPVGTAPGQRLSFGKKQIFLLPGVPVEMQAILREEVAPILESFRRGGGGGTLSFGIAGVPEAKVEEMVEAAGLGGVIIGYRLSADGVVLTARVPGRDGEDRVMERDLGERLKRVFGDHLFGQGVTLPQAVGDLLRKHDLSLAVAESFTGGALSASIVSVPGASDYFDRGFITYSNESKEKELGVPSRLIRRHGAVSRQVALAMAEGARREAGTDLGVSTTGIAGPAGGTSRKKVGLVCLGLSSADKTRAEVHRFLGDRGTVIQRGVSYALSMLYRHLAARS